MPVHRCAALLALACLLVIAGGCSGIHPYRSSLVKNLTVRTRTASGSLFTSVKARVDIYAVDADCNRSYQGSVQLQRPDVEIGLPASGASYLNFVFSSSTFLASSQGSTGFDAYLQTRPGYTYLAEASYLEGIYDVVLKEQKAGSGKLKELDYGTCTPKS